MNILEELQQALAETGVPVETGVFKDEAPAQYIVVVPLSDTFDLHADDAPGVDIQAARISIYSQSNYLGIKKKVVRALLAGDFTITARQYLGYESETGYYHYNVDAEKYYDMEDN